MEGGEVGGVETKRNFFGGMSKGCVHRILLVKGLEGFKRGGRRVLAPFCLPGAHEDLIVLPHQCFVSVPPVFSPSTSHMLNLTSNNGSESVDSWTLPFINVSLQPLRSSFPSTILPTSHLIAATSQLRLGRHMKAPLPLLSFRFNPSSLFSIYKS